MSDVVAARAAIRDVVEPLHLECHGYQVEEQLGRALGEDWLDDDILVYVKVRVTAGEGFPIQQYRDNHWSFTGAGVTREGAMQALQEGIEDSLYQWQKLLAEDVELAGRVGQRCRARKADRYSVLTEADVEAAREADEPLDQLMRDAERKVVIGVELDVVGHEPGKVLLRASDGDEWWVHRWQFYNHLTDAANRVIPDPYYEWLGDGVDE